MSLQFDLNKVEVFRNFKFNDENTIANLDGKGGVKAHGLYTGKWSAIGRSDIDKEANNKVRTVLLKSLGQAFGLSGMEEKDGVVTFSKEFMTKLTRILGDDILKRDDFKIGGDGVVKSGRPLTQRRIGAILTKAAMVGETNFDLGVYRMKLDAIKAELGLAGLSKEDLAEKVENNTALRMFMVADDGLKFLETQIFLPHQIDDPNEPGKKKTVYGPKNEEYDNSFIRVNPDYTYYKSEGMSIDDDVPMYQKRGLKDVCHKGFSGGGVTEMLMDMLPGHVFHLERANCRWKTCEDLEKMKRYIYSTEQLVVKKMVDLYFESKVTGKLSEFMKHLKNRPGACMEDKGLHLSKFEEENFKVENPNEAPLSATEVAELQRLANMSVGDPVDKQIYSAIESIYASDPSLAEKDEWDDALADRVKSKLIGKDAQRVNIVMDEANNRYKFIPIMDSKGMPLVSRLTGEEIDRIGKACLHNING